MTKAEYRRYFADVKTYVKITIIAAECGISLSSLSKFMKSNNYDFLLSLDKCNVLFNAIQDRLNSFVA